MMDEQSYAIWDEPLPPLPATSRLYHLAPMGIGTPEGERLTSYVVRLAAAHRVSVQSLVRFEIGAQLGPETARARERQRLPTLWRQGAASVNGVGPRAQAWVTAFEHLTQQPALASLTLLGWAAVLAPHGLLRGVRYWCPYCYTEPTPTGGVVYDPLGWALSPVTWCLRHHRPLATQCPICRHGQPMLAAHAQPGRCGHCGGWLGALLDGTGRNEAGKRTAWAEWMTRAVGSLIAMAPRLETPPQRTQILAIVEALVGRMPWRRNAALARLLHTHDAVVRRWRHGEQLPQLDNLVRLCGCVGQVPADLLTSADVRTMIGRIPLTECPAPDAVRRPCATRHDWNAIGAALEGALGHEPPLSGGMLGRQLKVSVSHLRARFPERYQAITARYRSYARIRSQQRRMGLIATIRQAVLQVHQRGVYPNLRRVASLLPKAGMMRAPEARAAWRAMLEELGWETRQQHAREENREA